MKPSLPSLVAFLCVAPLFASASAFAAEPVVTAENAAAGKAAFEQARSLDFSNPKAVELYRKATELDPDLYEAHQYYILAYANATLSQPGPESEKMPRREKAVQEVIHYYEKLAADHPTSAVHQWALGMACDYPDPDRAYHQYEIALKLDPKYGPAYDMLGISEDEKGNGPKSREFHRLATESWPDNVGFWRHYVGSWESADLKKGVALALQGAERFPEGAPSIAGYLAGRAKTEKESQEIYEAIRAKFPHQSIYGYSTLFSIYLGQNPTHALAFAQELTALAPDNKDWPMLVHYAQALVDAESLLLQHQPDAAAAALANVPLPRSGADRRLLDLTRARALDMAGKTNQAYADLLAIFVQKPNDGVHGALLVYGKKLGRNATSVESEILAQRAKDAKPGIPFDLVDYATGKPVSLADYKGRAVLVNFWYPKCGPCRGEFPYLQETLQKYQSRGFAILAINGHPPEDGWVMPLIKGDKLGFVPLKGDDAIVSAYKVRGFPSNFLYGPDGKIYYQPPPISGLGPQRELELQIEALLPPTKTSGTGVSPMSDN
jgi:thiol-disulfide isomerase/thioredoxin